MTVFIESEGAPTPKGGVGDVRSPRTRDHRQPARATEPPPNGGLAASDRGGCGLPRTIDLSRSLRTGGHAPPIGVRICEWSAGVTLSVVSPDPRVLGCIDPRTSRPATACIRVVFPEAGQRNSLRSSLCSGLHHSCRAKRRRHRC